jgi:hypothetical protein
MVTPENAGTFHLGVGALQVGKEAILAENQTSHINHQTALSSTPCTLLFKRSPKN